MTEFYRLFDPSQTGGMIPTDAVDLSAWNDRNWGIFRTVNEFDGPRRAENLKRIRAWFVDMDTGSKETQRARIRRSPLRPTEVVETRKGFHVYFGAVDGTPENYKRICSRLVAFFDGDPNARDVCRVLRVPGFYHCKDPADRFKVESVYHDPGCAYTEASMLLAFPATRDERAQPEGAPAHEAAGTSSDDPLWLKLYDQDQRELLQRISGLPCVRGERFTFRPVAGGKFNIVCDGRQSSCWIDADGRIGSAAGGGPTVYNWICWYGVTTGKEAVDVLREVAPELFTHER